MEPTTNARTKTRKKPVRKVARKRARKARTTSARAPHVYREPPTAAQLGITCLTETAGVICGAPAEWFDYQLGEREFYKGFVCDAHRVSTRLEKLAMPTTKEEHDGETRRNLAGELTQPA